MIAISKWSRVWNIQKETFCFSFQSCLQVKNSSKFFCKGMPLEYWRLTMESLSKNIFLHFITISNTQYEKDPNVHVYQDILWPCSVECFHAKMFRCKAINFWSEFSPSAGWARLLEKVKLWGKAHRQVVSFKEIQFFSEFYLETLSCQKDFINKKGVANGTHVLKI